MMFSPIRLLCSGMLAGGLTLAPPAWAQDRLDRPIYCFAPGTPQDVMDSYNRLLEPIVGPQYFTTTRWSGSQGNPRALTWSFVPDGVTVPYETRTGSVEDRPSILFSRMDSKFASAGGRQAWIAHFQACFNRWSQLTGTSYTRIRAGGQEWDDGASFGTGGGLLRGDIRIAMIVQDGQWNVLAYNYYPSHGDMVLDADENWASSMNNYRFLRNVLMHEHGHGLGLRHVCPMVNTKLMEPALSTSFDGPQHDDIRAAQYLYGDDYEDNNSVGAATDLGPLASGTSVDFGVVPSPAINHGSLLSLDATGEIDYFRFTVGAGAGVSFTLQPVGTTYDSSEQVGSNCTSGNMVNSLTRAKLALQVIGTNGSTVLATAASRPVGQAEAIDDLFLGAPGTYYLRVYATAAFTESQLYRILVSAHSVDCNNNGIPDTVDLANGTSRDCNANNRPDECEPEADSNGDQIPDTCQWYRGDFDLDGDVDMADFGFFQACLNGNGIPVTGDCVKACLDGDPDVDATDFSKFKPCLSGEHVPLNWNCR